MRTRAVLSSILASALLTITSSSHAQQAGFAVNRFEPAERGSEWFTLDSLDLRSKRIARETKLPVFPAVGVTFDYNHNALVAYNTDDTVRAAIVRNQFVLNAGASLAFADRFRVGVNMPFQLFADGKQGAVQGRVYGGPSNDQALGDLRLSADVRLLGTYGEAFTAALGVQVSLPTGDVSSYMSDGGARVMPRAQVAGDIGAFTYAARLAFQYRALGDTFGGSPIGSEFNYALSAGVHPFTRDVLIGPELFGSTVISDGAAFAKRSTPVEGIFGAHFRAKCFWIGAGVGAGLTRGFGAPSVRTLLSIEWAPPWDKPIPDATPTDSDGDGVLDRDDACVNVPGIKTHDPKTNGCPAPPSDRDADGIVDAEDACPDKAGVRSDDPKKNGCPPDKDGDGIADAEDACPEIAGVKSDDPKKNGCPPDKDGDGVYDVDDACVDVPGVKSSNPKFNGCPEDMDGDGIKNDVDACPDQKGEPDPNPAKNGCPRAVISNGQIKVLDQVRFKTSSADILPGKDSEDVLQAVLKILKEHPELKKVRIEGHTDNRGAAEYNKALSKNRAASVAKWLVAHGIEALRLSSAGFGQDTPLTTNETEDGRQQNRRVEFHVEEK